jgi:hypothetical protein
MRLDFFLPCLDCFSAILLKMVQFFTVCGVFGCLCAGWADSLCFVLVLVVPLLHLPLVIHFRDFNVGKGGMVSLSVLHVSGIKTCVVVGWPWQGVSDSLGQDATIILELGLKMRHKLCSSVYVI